MLWLIPLVMVAKTYDVAYLSAYDGDTVRVNIHLGMDVVLADQALRLCDIDAPEMRGEEKEAAIKSRDALISKIKAAKALEIVVPQKANCSPVERSCDKRGKYGRWLAYLYADGMNLNEWLLNSKLASSYPKTCDE